MIHRYQNLFDALWKEKLLNWSREQTWYEKENSKPIAQCKSDMTKKILNTSRDVKVIWKGKFQYSYRDVKMIVEDKTDIFLLKILYCTYCTVNISIIKNLYVIQNFYQYFYIQWAKPIKNHIIWFKLPKKIVFVDVLLVLYINTHCSITLAYIYKYYVVRKSR